MALPEEIRQILEEEEASGSESAQRHHKDRIRERKQTGAKDHRDQLRARKQTGAKDHRDQLQGRKQSDAKEQLRDRKQTNAKDHRDQLQGRKQADAKGQLREKKKADAKEQLRRRKQINAGKHEYTDGRRAASAKKHGKPRIKRKESLWLFPAVMFYNEVLLKLFAKTGLFRHFFYMLFFALSVGLFYAALTSFWKAKTNRLLTKILLCVNGVFFVAESIIRSVYQTYMSFRNLLSGAGNVATKYSGEMVRSIIFGLPKIILFALPAVLYFLYGKKLTAKRVQRPMSAVLAGAAVVLFFFASLAAGHGKNAAMYGAQFDFNRATETFGLTESQRLSFHYGIFGNKHSKFHVDTADGTSSSAQDETGDGAAPLAGEAGADPSLAQGSSAEGTGQGAAASSGANGTAGAGMTAAVTPIPDGPNIMDIDFSEAENSSSEEVRSLTSYLKTVTPSKKNAYTGLFKGKNLIMVCAESYCGSFISEELTPTLWRLTHNGFDFKEYYQPEWGGSTTTGEVAYLIGMAARYGDDSMIKTQNNNNYFTIANQLQRQGYSSCAFHNGDGNYYERNNTHENLGYNQFVANKSGIEDLCGYIYPDDTTMFENTIDLYINKRPFNIYYMTLSGHAKYEADEHLVERYYDRVDAAVGDQYEEKTKYYICYQMELEESMRILVEKLEQAGIADDTVIVMVGDHYPYGLGTGEAWGNDRNYITDLLGHSDEKSYEQDENHLVIWSGCLEHADKDKACSVTDPVFSLDIVPTLSNLFGLEYDSRLLPGRDVFGGTQPLVFWNNLSWVTDKGKYDSHEDVFTPRDGVTVDESYVESIHKLVQNKILQSRVELDNDYFRLLFGPDDITFAGQTVYEPGEHTDSGESGEDE